MTFKFTYKCAILTEQTFNICFGVLKPSWIVCIMGGDPVGVPGSGPPTFWQCGGPHADGPPLFGCILKIFYCRFDKNARKCYITSRVKHCRDSMWCRELVTASKSHQNYDFLHLLNYLSAMLTLLAHAVVRNMVSTVKTESCQFGFVVDGTRDCTGLEQESVCIRFVDKTNYKWAVHWVSLYNPPDTTGKTLPVVVKDVLTRPTLPLEDLRAHTYERYDGAAW